jgi:hypothetical protein
MRTPPGWPHDTGVLLNLFLIGLAIAFDPLPLTAFMVVLASKRGARKGAALPVFVAARGAPRANGRRSFATGSPRRGVVR